MLTPDQIADFIKNSYDKESAQRLGQQFCNHFNITDNFLFYHADNANVWKIIWEMYVNCE